MKNYNPKNFVYIIDLDERGEFKAHVENSNTGKIVFEFSNEYGDTNEEGEEYIYFDEITMVKDGYMKHDKDITGLKNYLVEMEVINQYDVLNFSK